MHRVIAPMHWQTTRNGRFVQVACALVVLLAAVFAALQAGLPALAAVFGLLGVYQAAQGVWVRRDYESALAATFASRAEKRVELTVDGEGIREQAEDIQSFAPWRAVKSFHLADAGFVLKLGVDLWTIIPRQAFDDAGDRSVDGFRSLLVSKGVPQGRAEGMG